MSAITPIEQVRRESPLLWPALVILVIAVACFTYYWDGHRYQFPYSTKHGPLVWPPPPETLHEATPANTPAPDLGNFEALKMPGGATLNVPANGMEAKLVAFIEDKSKAPGADSTFNFDRLVFYPASVTLAPASREQLHDIATIMKVFTNVHVRIIGYPDSTSDPKMAQDRAANVANNLIQLDLSGSRIQANGAGTAANAENHGVALQVTKK